MSLATEQTGAPRAGSAALERLRVLDLSGAMGNYAGKLFADMGADVILVEPPCGSELDRKSTRLNSSHFQVSRMPSSA